MVVPVYEEEDNLFPLYSRLREVLDGLNLSWEAVFVDDGSRDRSLERLAELSRTDPRVVVVELRRNFGQTAAMAAGFDHLRGALVITLDADLQNDPADIPRLLQKTWEGYDVVSGWRRSRKDAFLSRTLPSRIANGLISAATGVRLHDYGCTLKVYRAELLRNLNLYGEMHRFLPALVGLQGARITELEVAHHPRRAGRSKYGMARILKVLLDLLTVMFLSGYSTKPIYIFGGVASLLFGAGLTTAAIMIYLKLVLGISMILTPLPVLSAMLLILGVQALLMGLLAELVIRTYHESQNKKIYLVRRVVGRGD